MNCILHYIITRPDGTETTSILYDELSKNKNLKSLKPIANYIYAQYLADKGAAMDAAGYTARDENGEHLMKDVYKFYEVDRILTEQADDRTIVKGKELAGAVADNGEIIRYVDGKEALDKVIAFNNQSKSLVARVFKDADRYIITVEKRDSRTQWQIGKAEEQAKLFQAVSEVFNSVGLDLRELSMLYPNIFNITDIGNSIDYLNSFSKTRVSYATQKEIEFMLDILDPSNSKLQRILSKWGTIEEAAKNIYDSFKDASKLTSGEKMLVAGALEEAKKVRGIDFVALQKQLEQESKDYKSTSISYTISKILKEMREKYGIDDREIFVVDKEIRSIAQATGNAAIALNRRLRELEKRQGATEESKSLQKLINTLLQEIDRNRYFQGLVKFTAEAEKHIAEINNSLKNIEGTPGTQEYTQNLSSAIMYAKSIIEAYDSILEPLSRADTFNREEGITDENLETIMEISSKLHRQLSVLKDSIRSQEKGVVIEILKDWMGWGDTLPDGTNIGSLLNTLTDDIPIIEYLYSASRSSNPLLAALGTITRDAQDKRNTLMAEYNARIARADAKLKKAGYTDTKWMYDEEGRIINSYDWNEFSKQYKAVVKELKKKGLKGIDFKLALQDRINTELTEEVVVDKVSGRTERLPKVKKAVDPYNSLDEAQKEYYNEIMQIKGEIGTMLPEYAKSQFLPPQVRSNSLFDSNGWKDFFHRMGSNIKDAFRVTESDIDQFGATTFADLTLDGDNIISVQADFDDTPIKDIPVYYVRKLKDQSKLVKDFSGALQSLSSTAINYKCMSEVEDTALLISDFLSEQRPIERGAEGTLKADVLKGRKQLLVKRVGRYLNTTSTAHIAEGYIDREYYGEKLKDSPRAAKIVQTLLNYTRFKQLATNVPGGFSNFLVGEYQMLLEAAGRDNFNLTDYAWSIAQLFGDNTVKAPGRIMDYLTNNITELNTLIGNYFDPLQETFSEQGHKRYNGKMRNLFSLDYSGAVYGIGENLIHYTVMYAMLHHEKVYVDGKLVSLYEAFEKTDISENNAELKLKSGVRIVDPVTGKEGIELTDLNDQYLLDYRKKIRNVNQECHGAMNSEDRGLISQRLAGRLVMQFRQWMVEHYSRRYRGLHYDGSSKQWTEGWWVTTARFLGMQESLFKKWSWQSRMRKAELQEIITEYREELYNRKLSDDQFKSLEQKAKLAQKRLKNIRMATAEIVAVAMLWLVTGVLWSLDDDEENPLLRFTMYQLKRLSWDALAGTPIGAAQEAQGVIERPLASINVVQGLTYPLLGITDIGETYEVGIHKGENKYLVRVGRLLPMYKDVENWEKMFDDDHKYWHDMIIPYEIKRNASK